MKSYTDINQRKQNDINIVECGNMEFFDVNFATSFISNTAKFLDSPEKMQEALFHEFEGVKVYKYAGNIFIVEYWMKTLRDTERAILQEKYNKNVFFPNEENDGSQFPEPEFYTENNGKYYQCVRANLVLKDDFNIDEKGIHSGIIFSPLRYTQFLENNQNSTKTDVEKILNKKDSV